MPKIPFCWLHLVPFSYITRFESYLSPDGLGPLSAPTHGPAIYSYQAVSLRSYEGEKEEVEIFL